MAQAGLDTAISLNPNDPVAYSNRAYTQGMLGNSQQVIADSNKALSLCHDSEIRSIGLGLRAAAYLKERMIQDGVVDCSTAIRLDAKNYVAYYNRGWAYGELGQYAKEIDDLSQCIMLNPKYALAYYNRASAFGHTSHYQKQIADLTDAVAISPSLIPAYNDRAWAYWCVGQYSKAACDITKALSLDFIQYCSGLNTKQRTPDS